MSISRSPFCISPGGSGTRAPACSKVLRRGRRGCGKVEDVRAVVGVELFSCGGELLEVGNDLSAYWGVPRRGAAVAIGNVANALAEAVQSLDIAVRHGIWVGPVAVGDVTDALTEEIPSQGIWALADG